MFLIKKLSIHGFTDSVQVVNSLTAVRHDNEIYLMDAYWGNSKVSIGEYIDSSKFPKIDENKFLLSFVNSYSTSNYNDGFVTLELTADYYEPDNCEGYMIFIPRSFDLNGIKTDGERLFRRYPQEIIAVLREGNYLVFDNKRIEVINGKLLLEL